MAVSLVNCSTGVYDCAYPDISATGADTCALYDQEFPDQKVLKRMRWERARDHTRRTAACKMCVSVQARARAVCHSERSVCRTPFRIALEGGRTADVERDECDLRTFERCTNPSLLAHSMAPLSVGTAGSSCSRPADSVSIAVA